MLEYIQLYMANNRNQLWPSEEQEMELRETMVKGNWDTKPSVEKPRVASNPKKNITRAALYIILGLFLLVGGFAMSTQINLELIMILAGVLLIVYGYIQIREPLVKTSSTLSIQSEEE